MKIKDAGKKNKKQSHLAETAAYMPRIELVLPRKQLEIEYVQNNRGDKYIGEKYGFHETTIRKYRKKQNVSKKTVLKTRNIKLNFEQIEIINGLIASSSSELNDSGEMTVTLDKKYYSQIYWLNYKLKSISNGLKQISKNSYQFKTTATDYVKLLHGELYKDGVKFLNGKFLNRLTPLGISVWICNNGFSEGDCFYRWDVSCLAGQQKLIRDYLFEKWQIEADDVFIKEGLSFNQENSKKISKIIKYHLIPSMLYKLPKSERQHIIYLAGGMQAAPDNGVKWRRNLKQILNQHGYYCIDPTKEENCLPLTEGWRNELNSNFESFQKNMRVIIDNDLYFVNVSEYVVCLYDDFIGAGSFHEIGECYLKNKKLYLFNLAKKPLSKLSWWAMGCCTEIVETYEELLQKIPNISNNPYVPYICNES